MNDKAKSIKTKSLLIVEDIEENQFIVKAFLKGMPLSLDTASNGQVAVEKYKKQKFDVILMDIQMPKKDGISAIEEIRAYEEQNKLDPAHIFALTAYTEDSKRSAITAAGCNGFVTKPFKKDELLQAVETAIKA